MEGKRTIGTIRLENILSFGPDTLPFRLEPLNVLIGPNASGKSNLIEAFSILAYLSTDIQIPFREAVVAASGYGKVLRSHPLRLWKFRSSFHPAGCYVIVFRSGIQSLPSLSFKFGTR